MIEVFKTNVPDREQANRVAYQIENTMCHCSVNFDLEDCDKILRVKGVTSESDICQIKGLVKSLGFHAEILPDDEPFFGPKNSEEAVSMELSETHT